MNVAPRSWDEVTLSRYMQLASIPPETPAHDRSVRTVAVLTGRSLMEVRSMPVADYRRVAEGLSFTNDQPAGALPRELDAGGRKLRLLDDLSEVTLGELIDLEEYSSDWTANMHLAFGVLYREPLPDGSRPPYDPSAAQRTAVDLLDGMSAAQAQAAAVFFCLVATACSARTPASSAAEPR